MVKISLSRISDIPQRPVIPVLANPITINITDKTQTVLANTCLRNFPNAWNILTSVVHTLQTAVVIALELHMLQTPGSEQFRLFEHELLATYAQPHGLRVHRLVQ